MLGSRTHAPVAFPLPPAVVRRELIVQADLLLTLHACLNVTLRPGISSLDDILLTAVLGEGSYGTVYKALWRGTEVAVKVR